MRYVRKKLITLPLITACLFLQCGIYSFSGSGLPAHIRTVAVPVFGNQTDEIGIKENLTDAITEMLVTDGRLRVVGADAADSMIEGTVVDYKEQAYTYDRSENVQEYIVRIYVDVSYQDVKNRTVIWEEKRMEGWGTYDVSVSPPEDVDVGRGRAIAKLAEDIVNKTLSGW
jgi:hypothetical protein